MEIEELKNNILSLLMSKKDGKMQLSDLQAEFKQEIGLDLRNTARVHYPSEIEMLRTWSEVEVEGNGSFCVVRSIRINHIGELNQRSKKGSKRNAGLGEMCEKRCYRMSDPNQFEFQLSSSESNGFSDSDESLKRFIGPDTHEVIKKCSSNSDFQLKTSSPLAEEICTIRILDSINPHRFWFTSEVGYRNLDKLMATMQDFYSTREKMMKLTPGDLKMGQLVAALYSGIWHRGKIVQVLSPTKVWIFYVDFGTVEDDVCVDERVRLLYKDFTNIPAQALRGVLSHSHPKDGFWSDEAIKVFKNVCTKTKTFEAKVFNFNSEDCSHTIGLKMKTENGMKLLTEVMIESGHCDYYEDLAATSIVIDTELSFSDLELGKHLKTKENSWIPFSKKTMKKVTESTVITPTPTPKARIESFATSSKLSESENKLKPYTPCAPANIVQPITSKVSTQLKPMSLSRNVPKTFVHGGQQSAERVLRQVPKQNLDIFKVGSSYQVYIHSFDGPSQFYFFLSDEFCEIRSFLKKMNVSYASNPRPNDNFSIGTDVVTYSEENFCRGRIVEKIKDKFKIFLFDFGITVERRPSNIYKLESEWSKRQACVYQGYLEKSSLSVKDEQLLEFIKDRFIESSVKAVLADKQRVMLSF